MKKIIILFTLILTSTLSISQNKAIRSKVIGNGQPILFLPGFTTPGSIWKETVEHLQINSEAHLISYAGFNRIEPIKMPWYATIKSELLNYIQQKDLQEFIIIGHSMGGTLATDIASEIPSKVAKIILVDALPCMREVMMPGVPASNLAYESPFNKRMIDMTEDQFKMMATSMAGGMTDNSTKKEIVANWILEADRKTYVYGYTDLLKLDTRSGLKKIQSKALILVAPAYGNASKTTMENQYANLEHKTVKLAPKGKHFIMFDNEEWFYKEVNAFIISEK